MACFIVPVTEAVVTTIAQKVIKKKENKDDENRIRFSEKLKWLNGMLWGGSGLIAFEHLWHGEITPFFPFLTAASNKADMAEMFREMAVTGTGMAALVTAVWAVLVIAVSQKNNHRSESDEEAGVNT